MSDWPFDPNLKAWNTTYKPAVVGPGQPYWRAIIADGPMEIGGNHHLYVDVWDEAGIRVVGVPVLFYWQDGDARRFTEPKQGEGHAVDLPLYAGGNAYGVRIVDGSPSDDIFGFGLGNFVPHQAFRVVFQRTIADAAQPPTDPTPQPGMTAREVLDAFTRLAQELRGRV